MHDKKSTGKLIYGSEFKITLTVDPEIVNYYFSLIPKCKYANKQKHKPHITVVRSHRENIKNFEFWSKYTNEVIDFYYCGKIEFSSPYFYINVDSKRLCEIREELGLTPYRFSDSKFHITIANIK